MKFLKSFLIILVPIIFGYFFFGLGFGCGLGGSHEFACRIIEPTLLLSTWVTLISGLVVIVSFYKVVSTQSRKTAIIVFTIFTIIPIILFTFESVLSPAQKMQYLEGVTLESCASNTPSVPWGRTIGSDSCYTYFEKCENVQDPWTAEQCFYGRDKFEAYSDCNVFKDKGSENRCLVKVATKKKDLNYCSNISDTTGLQNEAPPYSARHYCVMDVLGVFDKVRAITANNYIGPTEEITRCQNLGGKAKDSCLSDIALLNGSVNDGVSCMGISDLIPWFKKNCEDMLASKEVGGHPELYNAKQVNLSFEIINHVVQPGSKQIDLIKILAQTDTGTAALKEFSFSMDGASIFDTFPSFLIFEKMGNSYRQITGGASFSKSSDRPSTANVANAPASVSNKPTEFIVRVDVSSNFRGNIKLLSAGGTAIANTKVMGTVIGNTLISSKN